VFRLAISSRRVDAIEDFGKCRITKGRIRVAMRDCTEMFNESGEHIATIGFNESYASRVRVDHREY
jgi:hypothetical protein